MRNLKLIIEYDGTRYQGWQSHTSGLTITGCSGKSIKPDSDPENPV
jgi:tRNA U38,U39,U40 pseudouridine synthase TruA